MTEQDDSQPAEEFHRDRREHGGIPGHLDDDQLARLTEEERVEAGLDAFDPDEVPPATDAPPEPDITESDTYQEARAEIRREYHQSEDPAKRRGLIHEGLGHIATQLELVRGRRRELEELEHELMSKRRTLHKRLAELGE